jgi:outer membrane protein assembly factor BamB
MMTRRLMWTCAFFTTLLIAGFATASEWTHWRGPLQTGVGFDKNLPSKLNGNVIWRAPYGSRSTCLVFNDRVYVINYDAKKVKVGDKEEDVAESIRERVMCLDAKTGNKLWEHTFPLFHTDIVTSRLGWTNLAADPETGYVYAHGTQGLFMCLDKSGKVVWQHSMGEEYGRVSGYGGRVTSPIVDEDLAILGMVNTSWGDQAKGGNRYIAFNKRTGVPVWWSQPAGVKGTYYSSPVIATINGQRQLISGGADGSVYGIKVRTGEPVWRYVVSENALNAAPVVQGNFVYIGHGEESPGTNVQGRVVCLDASKLDAQGEPELVWKRDAIIARYASPIINEGRLYVPDEGGKLHCLDAKTGADIWRFGYGRGEVRGSPVFADGKIYAGEVGSFFHILEPGAKKCKSLDKVFFPGAGGVDVEVNGTPAIANGRVYFSTSEEIICIGLPNGEPGKAPVVQSPAVKPGKITHVQIIPAEVALYSGESVSFKALGYDADGNFVKEVKAEWSLPEPTPPPGAKAKPPAIKGEITPDGKLTVDAKMPSQQGYVAAKADGVTGRARVRVVPRIPYANDFEKIPDGAVPAGWINTQGKFVIKTVNGNKVLAKVNNKFTPLISRGNAYITRADAKDYTIECDVSGTQIVGAKAVYKPEIGIGANRYTLIIHAEVSKLRLMSWDALPRIDKGVPFNWQPDTWYRLKLTTDMSKGIIRGKAWPVKQKEPAEWMLEVVDSNPITEGSATLYGYVTGNFNDKPGTEIYYDNLRITPNNASGKTSRISDDCSPSDRYEIVSTRMMFPLLSRLRR